MAAFQAASELGADMVELDCRLTKDGRVVVHHDATLQRLWGVPARLTELDWDEVRAISRDGQRVPLFEEVLEALALPLMVDLADPRAAEPTLRLAKSAGALERCIFAGHTGGLKRARELSRSARIALTWDQRRLPPKQLLAALTPEWWNPHYRLASKATVAWAHRQGMGVSAWTVDSPTEMARVLDAGADALITNQLAVALELLTSRREAR